MRQGKKRTPSGENSVTRYSLLHDVLSVLSIAGYAESNRESLCFVALHEKLEGLTLPILYRCD